jgi:hypothetical protein
MKKFKQNKFLDPISLARFGSLGSFSRLTSAVGPWGEEAMAERIEREEARRASLSLCTPSLMYATTFQERF